MLTEDENIGRSAGGLFSIAFPTWKEFCTLQSGRIPETSLRHATESALRHVVGFHVDAPAC